MKVEFFDDIDDSFLKFAVIVAVFEDKYVFCKHRERSTLEIPGGHREDGECIEKAAKRELYEETGALDYEISPICSYSVLKNGEKTCGMLYFSRIFSFDSELKSEIDSIHLFEALPPLDCWTYPILQWELIKEAKRRKFI